MDPHALTEDEVAAWLGMLQVHARVIRAVDERFRSEHGFSVAEFDVLSTLQESDGGLRMSELADRVMGSPSRMTRRVEALERLGFVARRPDAEDGRAVIAYVTDAGNAFAHTIARAHHEIVRALYLDVLTKAQQRQLGAIWQRMLAVPVPDSSPR